MHIFSCENYVSIVQKSVHLIVCEDFLRKIDLMKRLIVRYGMNLSVLIKSSYSYQYKNELIF